MPGSSPRGKIATLDIREELPPIKTVLDIGPGWGTYSKLLRKPGETWDAVEIFEPYIKKFNLHKYYDHIYLKNIVDFHSPKQYDLVILGDILEHVTEDDAKKTLINIFSFSKYCLLSLPLDDETGADLDNSHDYWGNIHEKHLSAWSNSEFQRLVMALGGEIIALKKYEDLGVYLIATKAKENYLHEEVTIFDKLNHGVFNLEGGHALKQKIKYYILKITPSGVYKYWKKKYNEKA